MRNYFIYNFRVRKKIIISLNRNFSELCMAFISIHRRWLCTKLDWNWSNVFRKDDFWMSSILYYYVTTISTLKRHSTWFEKKLYPPSCVVPNLKEISQFSEKTILILPQMYLNLFVIISPFLKAWTFINGILSSIQLYIFELIFVEIKVAKYQKVVIPSSLRSTIEIVFYFSESPL